MGHVVEFQEAVFDFLADSATHGGDSVRRIDTHAAAVFLAGGRAFKIKRAVRFPFLDYATAEKRKTACEAELKVNQPFAPGIYRRVVPIVLTSEGRLSIGGHGQPIEWAVEMQRFDEEATLDRLAEKGQVDAALADALGRMVATIQATEPAVPAEPWIDALATYIDQNEHEFQDMPELFPAAKINAISRASREALSRLRPILAERGARNLVRRGHGDLHLANIALIDGAPVPFDAIEFDPLIATGDVLYELAFLLMDLVERELRPTANIVFNRYLTQTRRIDDLDALAALGLFLSLRAAIRAKVIAARIESAAPSLRPAIMKSAQRYFEFTRGFIKPKPPLLLAIGGLSGTGKSVLARALAPGLEPAPGAVLLRSDVERKAMFGKSDTLPAAAYEPQVTAMVYTVLADKARRTAAAGHSVIIDAVFARPNERAMIAQSAKSANVRFLGLFLTADLATRLSRVGGRRGDASDADIAIARKQESYDLGDLDWRRIDASGAPETVLERARSALGERVIG